MNSPCVSIQLNRTWLRNVLVSNMNGDISPNAVLEISRETTMILETTLASGGVVCISDAIEQALDILGYAINDINVDVISGR